MKKRIKKAVLLTAAMLVLNTGVYADALVPEARFNIQSETFVIEGYFSQKEAKIPVTLNILRPENDTSDLISSQNPFDVMAFHDQIVTDEDGKYVFEVTPEGKSGKYLCYIKAGSDDKITLNLSFVNKEENKAAIDEMNKLTDSSSLVEFIAYNTEKLGFDITLYNKVSKKGVAEKLLYEREETGILDSSTPDENVYIFDLLVNAQALEENNADELVDNIFENKNVIALMGKYESTRSWYESTVKDNENMQKEITSRIYGKLSDSVSGLLNNIKEAMVLEIIENPNGFGNVKAIVSDFADDIGINNPSSSDDIYRKLSGNNYKSYAELYDAYKDAYGQKAESPYKPSGGSGGGGGSYSSNAVMVDNSLGVKTEPVPIKKYSFSDTLSVKWAYDAIEYLSGNEIISGKSDGMFYPYDNVTREEFVKILVNAFDFTYTNNSLRFSDVDKNVWYYSFVKAAYQNEIAKGESDEYFGIGKNITRQDMAVMVMNAINKKGIVLSEVNERIAFSDNGEIAPYAAEAVEKLQKAGIINGIEDNTFRPEESATRAQAAVIVYGVLVSAGL